MTLWKRGKAGWWCQHTEIPFYGSVCSVHKSSSSQPRAQHLGNHSTSEWTQPAGNEKQAASDKQRQEQNNSMPGLNFREIALRLETNTNTLCYLWNLLTAFLKTVTHVNCELANDKSWILNLTSHSWGVRLDLRVCKPQYLILHISAYSPLCISCLWLWEWQKRHRNAVDSHIYPSHKNPWQPIGNVTRMWL